MSFLEAYRKEVVSDLFSSNTFSNSWESWSDLIKEILTDSPSFAELQDLGSKLRDVFFSTNTGRDQGSVSGGGASWECLLTWYLNLGLIGTNTIVIKHKKQFIPSSIYSSLSVSYEGFRSNTESDLLAITFPASHDCCYNASFLERFNNQIFNTETLTSTVSNHFSISDINRLVDDNFSKIKLNVIQCKTNWNDNAQIPMAWDMIYASSSFINRDIRIGEGSLSIHKLAEFKYSFATVPTQKNIERNYKPQSTAVARVKNLSGHNFWGMPTTQDVARSVGDIFELNYCDSFDRDNFHDFYSESDTGYFRL